jgi:iron complex transport system ATP-binding protein
MFSKIRNRLHKVVNSNQKKPAPYSLQNVSYSYGQTRALDNLNLTLDPGKFYGIIGPNGCGKTTFLDLLVGSKECATGTVLFKDRPVCKYSKRQLATEVALVPQDFNIGFDYTVEEVVMMGRHPYISRFGSPSPKDWQLVEQAMESIGIGHFGKRSVTELSGGEKQRVVVARALAQDTEMLLFDEATSNLDVKYTLQIFNTVRELVQKECRTVVAVIHNLNLAAAYCDELIIMEKGRVYKTGTVADILTSDNIKQVFGVDSDVHFDSFSGTPQVSYRYGR